MNKKENESEPKAKMLTKHMTRAALRMLPFIPGPELYDLLNDLSKSRTSLDQKVTKAYESLQETSQLISELEEGLKERVTKVEKLKDEYDRYSELAEIEEGKAGALIKQLEISIGKGKKRDIWVSLMLNLFTGLVVFILGIFAGPYLTTFFGIGTP